MYVFLMSMFISCHSLKGNEWASIREGFVILTLTKIISFLTPAVLGITVINIQTNELFLALKKWSWTNQCLWNCCRCQFCSWHGPGANVQYSKESRLSKSPEPGGRQQGSYWFTPWQPTHVLSRDSQRDGQVHLLSISTRSYQTTHSRCPPLPSGMDISTFSDTLKDYLILSLGTLWNHWPCCVMSLGDLDSSWHNLDS